MTQPHSSSSIPESGSQERHPAFDGVARSGALHWPKAGIQRRRRFLSLSLLCMGLGPSAAVIAWLLLKAINFCTGFAYYGHIGIGAVSPARHHLGLFGIVVPALGGVVVGLMARFGTKAIRGHGIPEAMEQVLTKQSRISPRVLLFKPLSSAIAIGTGGPFGAEGPIIATGGALGSLVGQVVPVTSQERKTLLAAGAAAGMTAIFGTPVAAVLLAVELLLFEFRARSVIPVALACAMAAAARIPLFGKEAVFPMPLLNRPGTEAIFFYALLGLIMGALALLITRLVYAVEDNFEKLPIHWMWWPAIGGLAVGIIGHFAPRTLGVGYENIGDALSGNFTLAAVAWLCAAKLASWSLALGSGTSGGTLAPLMTVGSGTGYLLGSAANHFLPAAGIDARLAALVGLAALFSGSSRAWLAATAFALESTGQVTALTPILAGCAMSQVVCEFADLPTIMTEKIVRRGLKVPSDFLADNWGNVPVAEAMTSAPVTVRMNQNCGDALRHVESLLTLGRAAAFPVVDEIGRLYGVVSRRELEAAVRGDSPDTLVGALSHHPAVVISPHSSLREATEHMVRHDVRRLVVVAEGDSRHIVGMLTHGDALRAWSTFMAEQQDVQPAGRGPLRPRRSGDSDADGPGGGIASETSPSSGGTNLAHGAS